MNKYISNKYKVYFHALLGKTLLKMIILPILIQVNQKKKKSGNQNIILKQVLYF